jgi:iron complex outermembrane receptor protein
MRIQTLIITLAALAIARVGRAQDTTHAAHRDSAAKLGAVTVTATHDHNATKPLQALTLPAIATINAKKIEQTVNFVDAEDAVKYLPSVFLRKRNNGDTQATLGTRVWGVSSSARSLIFADGVPLSALIANNNTIGGPRWGLVSPSAISRIDVMYGPFSAAYAGNSMGAVMEITTRMPDSLTGSIAQTHAAQLFDLYGTRNTYNTAQTSGDIANRWGKFSIHASGNYQDSHSQPLLYVTSGSFPSGTTGGYTEQNKLGAAANVLGATGLLHTQMFNGTLKLCYDLTPAIRATYSLGVWSNNASSGVETYVNSSSKPTFAGQAGFATGFYDLDQRHISHSITVTSNTRGDWDWDVVAARYGMNKDQQRFPTTSASTDTTFGTAGRAAVLDGTHWMSLDAKTAWHRGGLLARHIVSFGAHFDSYDLENPTFNTSEWRAGAFGSVASEGDGKTRTTGLWVQDAWRVTDLFKVTVGGRLEHFKAMDGLNVNGNTRVVQPEISATRFSPKLVAAWTPTLDWTFTGSVAKAYRFATPAELYQLVTTGATFTSPDPKLRPDNVIATELRANRSFEHGNAQLALFHDDVHDAIISQFLPLVQGSSTLYSYLSNVDHVRARGVELTGGMTDVGVHGLEVNGSVTYLDARTLALSGRASASAPAGNAVGKFLPNIPKWRGSLQSTYKPIDRLSLSMAARYSSLMYTTLDNADVRPNTYGGFSEWFVMDAHSNLRIDRHWSASLGVDNLLNRKYFLFHPFPQRTLVGSAKFTF